MSLSALTSLVADYSDSSEDESSDNTKKTVEDIKKNDTSDIQPVNYFETTENLDDDEPLVKKNKSKKSKSKKRKDDKSRDPKALPNPFGREASSSSVFSTPFQREQENKKNHLEKHVKLTAHSKDVQEINGKKICLSYRRGRCRFGHQCKFAHDSDLITPIEQAPHKEKSCMISSLYNMKAAPDPPQELNNDRKRKPGLKEGLVPSKKSRENFKKQQNYETPWVKK